MLRFILSFFGGIFSVLTLGVFFGALTLGGVFWMYGKDLPNHETLARYSPPTISRVYSTEGRIIDEFARERRLFVPSNEINSPFKAIKRSCALFPPCSSVFFRSLSSSGQDEGFSVLASRITGLLC